MKILEKVRGILVMSSFKFLISVWYNGAAMPSSSEDGVNQHFEKIADFLKKFRGFSVHVLEHEQFLYNIYKKAQNQEMPRAFSRIFTGSENQIKSR